MNAFCASMHDELKNTKKIKQVINIRDSTEGLRIYLANKEFPYNLHRIFNTKSVCSFSATNTIISKPLQYSIGT